MLTDAQIKKIKVDEIRKYLNKRDITVVGRKPVLIERLKKAIKEGVMVILEPTSVSFKDETHFARGLYWKMLHSTIEE